MQTTWNVLAIVSAVLPVAVCFILGYRLVKNRQTDWKVAACLSASALATALLALLATEKILFLQYKDAVVQINQKRDEVKKLADQQKRLAIETVKAFGANLSGMIAAEHYDGEKAMKALENVLKAAEASESEINEILGRTISPKVKP